MEITLFFISPNMHIRMKEDTQQLQGNTGNHGEGVFAWGGKACGKAQMSMKRSLCQKKTEADWNKELQIRGAGRKSRKRPTLVVGKKSNGKYQLIS